MPVCRNELRNIPFLVERQEHYARRRYGQAQFARELAVQAFPPEVVGEVGLRRIQPEPAQRHHLLERFRLAPIEEPATVQLPKGLRICSAKVEGRSVSKRSTGRAASP